MKPAARPKPAAKAAPKAAPNATAKPKAAAPKAAPKAKAAAPKAKAPAKAAAKPKAAAPKAASKAKAPAKPAAKPKATAPKAAPKAKAPARSTAKPKAAAPKAAAPKARPAAKAPAAPRPTRAKQAPRQKVEPALLDRLVAAAVKSLEDDKAENIVVLDVTGRADYADRLIIATGLADRQIQAMATHLEDAFEKTGLKLKRDAIQGSPDWVLIDCGDLVVHLFKPEARSLYALERMWGPDSPSAAQDRTPLPDDGTGGSTATEADEE